MRDIWGEGLRRQLSIFIQERGCISGKGVLMIAEERMRRWTSLYSFRREGLWGQRWVDRSLQGTKEESLQIFSQWGGMKCPELG